MCSLRTSCLLQVAFHLQTQTPPILPPICSLFKQESDVLQGRPLHAGQQAQDGVLEVNRLLTYTMRDVTDLS